MPSQIKHTHSQSYYYNYYYLFEKFNMSIVLSYIFTIDMFISQLTRFLKISRHTKMNLVQIPKIVNIDYRVIDKKLLK